MSSIYMGYHMDVHYCLQTALFSLVTLDLFLNLRLTGLELLVILLPQLRKCWDHRGEPSYSTLVSCEDPETWKRY